MGAGHLDVPSFERLLTANPQTLDVELSNYGEMFLNPRLRDILRIAAEHKVILHADNGVNMNHVSDEILEALVQHRFRSITVSIDGASAETYAVYRRRGDFDRVIANVRKLNEYKRRHAAAFPLLTWQFIVFGHNEHEIGAARRMASELGMAFRPKISWDDDFSPVRNDALVRIETGLPATRARFRETAGVSYNRGICYQLWNQPVLNWDGRLTGCCRNFWGDFGANAFQGGLDQALKSPPFRQAQRMLLGELYLAMREDGNWLTAAEVEKAAASPAVLTGVVVDAGDSGATHADVFIAPGHEVNRMLLAQPPKAQRFELGVSYAVLFRLAPGNYTLYALPKRLDPAFRIHYPPMKPVTAAITVPARPVVSEYKVTLA